MNPLRSHFYKKFLKQERPRHRFLAVTFLLIGMVTVLGAVALIFYFNRSRLPEGQTPQWGITFSRKYSEELGLPWQVVYLASLDDLGARRLRIPAYWNEIEPIPGLYDFAALDWMLDHAASRNAQVIIAAGLRLPRWPECHPPYWLAGLPDQARHDALLNYLRAVIERYRANPALIYWQIENEPFLDTFGKCPPTDSDLLRQEVGLARTLDPRHEVIITESGELASWIRGAQYADILGISLYRTVWNEYFGFFHWPLPSWYYRKKAELTLNQTLQDVIISEIQLEPWTNVPMVELPIKEQRNILSQAQFKSTIQYARDTGFSELYLWGIEWWYYMKLHGHPEYWDEGKHAIRNH